VSRLHKRTELRKLEIAEAARSLIIRKGSEHLTIRNIARQIDLTEAAIYRHFKSKNEILLFLSDYLTDQLIEDLQRASTGQSVTLQTVDRVLRGHLSAIEQRRGISFQIFAEVLSFGDARLNRKTAYNIDRYIKHLAGLLALGAEHRRLPAKIDSEAAALLLFGMIQSLVSLWTLNAYSFNLLRKYAVLWRVFRSMLSNGE
jgi:AcrR family transcriptional regulator